MLHCASVALLWLWLQNASAAPTSTAPSDFPGDETPYRIIPTSGDAPADSDVNNKNVLGTWLYGYTECRKRFGAGAGGVIDRAYYDAWLISNQEGVKSHIDWNSAAALEFLGPSAKDVNQQAQIQAVLANVATTIYDYKNYLVQHYIKVRCDDPDKFCPQTCDGRSKSSKTYAYAGDQDPAGSGYPFINFCPDFFDQLDLTNAIAFGSAQSRDKKYDLENYNNRATTFLHELFHLSIASGAPTLGPRVIDYRLKWFDKDGEVIKVSGAYGPLKTKMLARFPGSSSSRPTGYYVQRNAENLMLFAFSKYVTQKIGNIYPYLPIVEKVSEVPFKPPPRSGTLGLDYIATFVSDGNEFYLNSTDDSAEDCVGSSSDGGEEPVVISDFTADSEYPDEYLTQRKACLKSLEALNTTITPDTPKFGSGGQQIALATYIDPGANPDIWNRLIEFPADKVSILVANVVNGPDSSVNQGWKKVLPKAKASGKTILGYVRTGYLGISFQQFTTRLGSYATSDWVAQIQEDVDQWYRLYPGLIGGIFFDEAWNTCGENNVHADLYKFITQSTKRNADALLTYESDFATYTGKDFVSNDWTPKDPRKIWHIIHTVPPSEASAVAALALSRGAGMIEITNDVMPNPYDTLPDDSYMKSLMDVVEGGTPLDEGLYAWPALTFAIEVVTPFFTIDKSDYSSAALSWKPSQNAIGYRITLDSEVILELPPSSTKVTVGGLSPGGKYRFVLYAINPDGSNAPQADAITMQATPLPGNGRTVASTSVSASDGQTVYHARILVPYAFVRVFIWGTLSGGTSKCDSLNGYGWLIDYDSVHAVCNHYMIEGGTLYRYVGEPVNKSGDMPWKWQWVAEVPIVQDGYDWTWTAPIGLSTLNTEHYMIQVQGYGPMANVLNPCPKDYLGNSVWTGVATYCA